MERDGRSVLGMVAVQVERDPKTGAAVVKSVAPVSAAAGAPTATAVFDDGRRSVHAIGGSGSQPSSEELGQILSVVEGVGMKVLLDKVEVKANEAETRTRRSPEEKTFLHHATQICRSYELRTEICAGEEGDQRSDEGPFTVERVIITEDGEEQVVGAETSTLEKEAGKVFQDIPLDGNEAEVQGGSEEKAPSTQGRGSSKNKSCQCCSVM